MRRLFKSSFNWLQNITDLKVIFKDLAFVKELIANLNRMNSLKMLYLKRHGKLMIQNEIDNLFACPELEQLTELGFTVGDFDFNTVKALTSCSYLRNLESLSIWSDIRPNGISTIATSPYLKNLKNLELFNSPTVNDCRIISENLTHLESFYLTNCEIAGFKYITTLKLKKLGTRYGTVCLNDLNVESMSNLESIKLVCTKFDIPTIKILGSNNFRNLSSICIHFNGIYAFNLIESDFTQIFTDNLKKLSLLCIKDGFANAIIKLVSKNIRNLTELSIGDIVDSDLKSFTDNLDCQSCLKTFCLVGKITDTGIAYLTECKNLTQIDSLTMRNEQCTIMSIDHVALSNFSNKIKTLSYFVGDELSSAIKKRINNWKSKNLLTNLEITTPRTNPKRVLATYLNNEQQTLSSKKTK